MPRLKVHCCYDCIHAVLSLLCTIDHPAFQGYYMMHVYIDGEKVGLKLIHIPASPVFLMENSFTHCVSSQTSIIVNFLSRGDLMM